MKKILSLIVLAGVFMLSSFIVSPVTKNVDNKTVVVETKYEEGWKEGFCERWREEKGKTAYCPPAPYAQYPTYPKSTTSYKDGYNDGFLRGMRDARK